jgi:hypothetical protein
MQVKALGASVSEIRGSERLVCVDFLMRGDHRSGQRVLPSSKNRGWVKLRFVPTAWVFGVDTGGAFALFATRVTAMKACHPPPTRCCRNTQRPGPRGLRPCHPRLPHESSRWLLTVPRLLYTGGTGGGIDVGVIIADFQKRGYVKVAFSTWIFQR